jgi:hypothetical protein
LFALATDAQSDSIGPSEGGETTSMSVLIGGCAEVKKLQRKREVRQMPEHTPHFPVDVEPDGSRVAVHMKCIVAQPNSVEIEFGGGPTGRLACAESEIAA